MVNTKEKLWDTHWFRPSVLFILFVIAYWVPIKAMAITWYDNEDYSYGFLIPLVSVYFLWDMRKSFKDIPIRSSWQVIYVLGFFVLLSLYGILGSSGNISMPSLPILIILFAAFCFGIEAAKRLILPLGFLVFMIPLPPFLERTVGITLKAISSKLGGLIISAFGIPVHVSGNIIDLGVTQLQVVDACSGMRYIFPLLALGVLYSKFFERVMWKRIVCVAATIPIAILTNALRIGITGILTDKFGVKVAEGFFHGFSGWALFMVAFAFLFALGRILAFVAPEAKKLKVQTEEGEDKKDIKETPTGPLPVVRANITPAFHTSVGILIVVALLSLSTKALPPVTLRGGLVEFPVQFADWKGKSEIVDQEIVIKSGAEESFSGTYRNGSDRQVSLYIGYRSTAFLANENFFHSPTVCLPSSGWQTVEETTRIIDNVQHFGDIKVTKMIMEYMGNKHLVYFWFQTKDKATHDKNINRFHLALHAIQRDNTHDLFIRPITPIYPGESVQDAEKRMDGFVRDMMGTLLEFLKDKQEIR